MFLWNYDADNQAWIDVSTRRLSVKIAGATWATSPILWNIHDTVDLQVVAGDGINRSHASYCVNDGAAQLLGTSDAPQAAFNPTGPIDLMCNGTSNQLSAYIERVEFCRSLRPAAWDSAVSAATPTVASVDFTSLAAGVLAGGASAGSALELATGCRLTRASAATVQTSANTINVTPGVDAARIGRFSAQDALALVIEGAGQNLLGGPRAPTASPWTNGTGATTPNATAGPDGSVLALRATPASGQLGQQQTVTVAAGAPIACSMWCKSVVGAAPNSQCQVAFGDSASMDIARTIVGPQNVVSTIGPGWMRFWVISAGNASNQASIVYNDGRNWTSKGGLVAGPRDAYLDFPQIELGQFLTEAMLVDRAGDHFWHPDAASLVSAARFSPRFRFRPKGASNQYASNMFLWNYDADNQAWINCSTRTLNVKIAGATWTASAMTWSAGDIVDLQIAAGDGASQSMAKYRIGDGAVISLGTSGSPQAAFSPTGAIDLFCNGTSNQLSAYVERADFYRSGRLAYWAV
jgi:hypothetical protein